MMAKSKITRRGFMRGSLAGAAAAPFLRSFGARAQDGGARPKLLVYASGAGALVGPRGGPDHEGWLPSSLHEGEGLAEAPTTAGPMPETLTPFERHASRMLLIDGLRSSEDVVGGHANAPVMLSGGRIINDRHRPLGDGEFRSDTTSVDQVIAERLGSRVLGMSYNISGYQGGEGYISHTAPGVAYTPYQNAHDAFDAVFASGSIDDGSARRRRSVLDAMSADLAGLRSRLPAADRPRLEQHLDAVQRIEQDMARSVRPACSVGSRPPEFDSRSNREVPRLLRSYASTMTQALACGYTQVGFIQTGNLEGGLFPLWSEFFSQLSNASEHAVAHKFGGIEDQPGAVSELSRAELVRLTIEFQRFHNTMVAEILDQLAATPDVDGGSLLDNTIVLQVRPMGKNHDPTHLMWNIFGGENLGINTGRFLRLDSREGQQPYVNDLLVSIAAAMGVSMDSIGHPDQNRAPLNLG